MDITKTGVKVYTVLVSGDVDERVVAEALRSAVKDLGAELSVARYTGAEYNLGEVTFQGAFNESGLVAYQESARLEGQK